MIQRAEPGEPKASVALYRDILGFPEVWREGDATVALALPGTEVQLMLDAHDPDAPLGPLFVVDSVEAFHTARRRRSPITVRSPRPFFGRASGFGGHGRS